MFPLFHVSSVIPASNCQSSVSGLISIIVLVCSRCCLQAPKTSVQRFLNQTTGSADVTKCSRSDLSRPFSHLSTPSRVLRLNLLTKQSVCISHRQPRHNRSYLTPQSGFCPFLTQRLSQESVQSGFNWSRMASTSTSTTKPEARDLRSRDLQTRGQLREVFLTAVRSGMPQQMLEKVKIRSFIVFFDELFCA